MNPIWIGLAIAPLLLGRRKSGPKETVGRDILPDTPIPGVMPSVMPEAPDGRRALAARLVVDLMTAEPGQESKQLVHAFQAQEGLKASGYYNPSTAFALTAYGYVPPAPLYWPKSGQQRARANLAQRYRDLASSDPQRAEEWKAAAALLQ